MSALNALFLVAEGIVCVLYIFCTTYPGNVNDDGSTQAASAANENQALTEMAKLYPYFQHVHTMIFVGFGFLMVFLKTHCWTSIGFNFLISCWALQVNILLQPLWKMVLHTGKFERIELTMESLITGDFAAGAVLITMGAVLGKTTWAQLFVLGTLELVFYGFNENICVHKLGAADCGGSMYVHTFGAYFGVAASLWFAKKEALADKNGACGADYTSNLVAMFGCLFLWMYWPSFNGALAAGTQQQTVALNTVLSISASGLAACYVALIKLGKLDVEVLLNATLAGGVAIGTSCDLCKNAGLAILVGLVAGIVCAAGYLWLNGALQAKGLIHDTCGVQYLHGIPGVLGGLVGALFWFTIESNFKNDSYRSLSENFETEGWTGAKQGWMQLGALACTLAVGIGGGLLSGLIASRIGDKLEQVFEDGPHVHEAHEAYMDKLRIRGDNESIQSITGIS